MAVISSEQLLSSALSKYLLQSPIAVVSWRLGLTHLPCLCRRHRHMAEAFSRASTLRSRAHSRCSIRRLQHPATTVLHLPTATLPPRRRRRCAAAP